MVASGFSEDTLRLSLASGLDPNSNTSSGNSLLNVGIERQSVAVVRLLLDKGADPNLRDQSGALPLYNASATLNPDILEVLFEHGARLDAFEEEEFHTFLCRVFGEPNEVRWDISDFQDMYLPLDLECSGLPLILAAVVSNNDPQVLIQSGFDVNRSAANGRTPLEVSVVNHLDAEDTLLVLGADPRKVSSTGVPIAKLALNEGTSESVRALRASIAGQGINSKDYVEAFCHRLVTGVPNGELLSEFAKAAKNLPRNCPGTTNTILEVAAKARSAEALNIVQQYRPNDKLERWDAIEWLAESEDPTAHALLGRTLTPRAQRLMLCEASSLSSRAVAWLALRTGSRPPLSCEDGRSVLSLLVHDEESVADVLRRGANPNGSARDPVSPLENAVANSNGAVVVLLLDNGAKGPVSRKTLESATRMDSSVQRRLWSISPEAEQLAVLCKRVGEPFSESHQAMYANPSIFSRPCADGKTPLELAIHNSHPLDRLAAREPQQWPTDMFQRNEELGQRLILTAARKGNLDLVAELAAMGARLTRLNYDEFATAFPKKLTDDQYSMLRKAGLSESIPYIHKVSSECNERDEKSLTLLWNDFQRDTDVRDLVNAKLAAYDHCVQSLYTRAVASPHYPYSRSTSRPYLSKESLLPAKYLTVRAMTKLAPASVLDQDISGAVSLIQQASKSIEESVAQYQKADRAWISEQIAKAEEERRRAERSALIGTVLMGAVAAYGVREVNRFDPVQGRQLFTQWSSEILTSHISRIDDVQKEHSSQVARLNSLTQGKKGVDGRFDDDGVRIIVPRIGSWHPFGSLESQNSLQHFSHLFRITSQYKDGTEGFCTAAAIRDGRILTAQHCLHDREKGWAQSIRLSWEYLGIEGIVSPDGRSYTAVYGRESEIITGSFEVETAQNMWTADWGNDWAILTYKGSDIPWRIKYGLTFASEGALRDLGRADGSVRVVRAGYAAHVNEGSFITMDWGCRGTVTGSIVYTRCRGWKGDSGSPVVIASGPEKGNIAGVHAFGRGEAGARFTNEGGGPSARHIQRELDSGKTRKFSIASR
ncbi:ankyrin repeat domain-containing protein [Thioalkalivibrio nitratireducens]